MGGGRGGGEGFAQAVEVRRGGDELGGKVGGLAALGGELLAQVGKRGVIQRGGL